MFLAEIPIDALPDKNLNTNILNRHTRTIYNMLQKKQKNILIVTAKHKG